MPAPILLRQVLLSCVRFHNFKRFAAAALPACNYRRWCSAALNKSSAQADEKLSPVSRSTTASIRTAKENSSFRRWEDDPDYRKWKDKEEEILGDIQPIVLLTKDILHSGRYMDGERLTVEDEKAVLEKLLAYHPHSEDKIGCGLESIMCLALVHFQSRWQLASAGRGYLTYFVLG